MEESPKAPPASSKEEHAKYFAKAQLMKRVQRTLAPLTLAGLIPYGMININSAELWGYSSVESSPDIGRSQQAMMILNTRGESELETLRNFLNKNRALFPSYKLVSHVNIHLRNASVMNTAKQLQAAKH